MHYSQHYYKKLLLATFFSFNQNWNNYKNRSKLPLYRFITLKHDTPFILLLSLKHKMHRGEQYRRAVVSMQ